LNGGLNSNRFILPFVLMTTRSTSCNTTDALLAWASGEALLK
jgi:hypothetical protein